MSLSIRVMFARGTNRTAPMRMAALSGNRQRKTIAASRSDMTSVAIGRTRRPAFELAAAEVRFAQADVVVRRFDRQLGPRFLQRVGHLGAHDRPDRVDLLQLADGIDLLPLVAA